jgi:MYXO-CTERM domain-containing protein
VHKYHQGWMSGCNVVTVGTSTTVTLVPQELPCDGVQLLQIPAPKTRSAPAAGDRQGSGPMLTHYYLEMRGPHGFDSGLGPMVLVSIGPNFRTASQSAPYVYMLDMNASTTTHTDAGLRAGGSYSDPSGGFTVTVNSIDNMSANVTITTNGTGSLMCSNNTAFTAPGPGADSCGPLAGGGTSTGVAGSGGGAGGRGGAGGSAGPGGRGGAGGASGRGGAAGMGVGGAAGAGSAGTNGAAGSAGATGAAGSGTAGSGTAGSGTGAGGTIATGTGGTIMTGMGGSNTGIAGSPTTAGTAGSGTGEGGTGIPGAVSGGCECGVDATGPTPGGLLLLLAVVSIARRRSRRASPPA